MFKVWTGLEVSCTLHENVKRLNCPWNYHWDLQQATDSCLSMFIAFQYAIGTFCWTLYLYTREKAFLPWFSSYFEVFGIARCVHDEQMEVSVTDTFNHLRPRTAASKITVQNWAANLLFNLIWRFWDLFTALKLSWMDDISRNPLSHIESSEGKGRGSRNVRSQTRFTYSKCFGTLIVIFEFSNRDELSN